MRPRHFPDGTMCTIMRTVVGEEDEDTNVARYQPRRNVEDDEIIPGEPIRLILDATRPTGYYIPNLQSTRCPICGLLGHDEDTCFDILSERLANPEGIVRGPLKKPTRPKPTKPRNIDPDYEKDPRFAPPKQSRAPQGQAPPGGQPQGGQPQGQAPPEQKPAPPGAPAGTGPPTD